MFHFLFSNQWYKQTVRSILLLRQESDSKSDSILSALDFFTPISFARAPNGYTYLANGLRSMTKWNGYLNEAVKAGVPAPTTAVTLTGISGGTIDGFYFAFQRWIDVDGNPGNLSLFSNEVGIVSAASIAYANVQAPTDTRVVKRQILRNTAGQASVFYVDVETTDLARTTFSSARSDDDLSTQEAVALFDERNNLLANRFGEPPNDKPNVAYYLGRLFAAGETPYSIGQAEVTCGSKTVTGIGTQWTSEMAARFLYILNDRRNYEIKSIDIDNQTLTLLDAFRGNSDKFAIYTIRSAPAERDLLHYTEAGLFEAWSAFNALQVGSGDTGAEAADDITGLMATNSFLFILQRHHIYRLTYQRDPGLDGGLFLSVRRGCINNRCWVHVDDMTYMMDDRGVYRFDGGDGAEDVSAPIQDIFRSQQGEFRINWSARRYFHAVHTRAESVVRFFLSLSGQRLPRHALAFNYQSQQWWLEEYAFPVPCSTVWQKSGESEVIVGGPAKRVFTTGEGTLDGPDPASGTTRGLVTSSAWFSLSDSLASFASAGLVGSPISLLSGKGKGQTRIVSSVSGAKITVTQPWTVKPDTTSKYQIGGVAWRWRDAWRRWTQQEQNSPRRIVLVFAPTANAQCDTRLFEQHKTAPTNWGVDWPRTTSESTGWKAIKGNPDIEIDLTKDTGTVQIRLDESNEFYTERSSAVSIELRGFSGPNDVTINDLVIEGAA